MGCGQPTQTAIKTTGEEGAVMLTEAEIDDIFKKFDENGDGYIACEELQSQMTEQGFDVPAHVLKAMIAMADDNADNKIQKSEFRPFIKIILFTPTFEEILFKIADKNNDGMIDQKEFMKLKNKLNWEVENPAEKMTKEEFMAFVTKNMKQ
ncbi:EF_hand domain-containing protein [Hexamita inflata]|uniref:EF hand domain-containing protein n=1 Tax=Hexamita inflata TaxID=28002 RepID=A0AA86NUP9_9EUKA|nr:EF hand domain-containing protein [Hexamita inflata]CAI9954098.1 EF hand domain-containing protein [Hexamita inflata]CAI9963311.1 EF hand domain-containing protein [Hexamita inflata]